LKKIKEEFELHSEEESLFKKEDSKQSKKRGPKEGLKKNKDHGSPYKPDKAVLTEIKEILTYRMKSQRYPFSDLKADIEASE
jgi:hypothetical protein